jgi:excisionase family DNA binding protein
MSAHLSVARLSASSMSMKSRPAPAPSQIMTVAELADYLRVDASTVYRLVRHHQIPALKIGSRYRFDKDTIKKWMTDVEVKG